MELLETIAGGVAVLFESARLSENLEQTRKEIAVTDEVARIITTSLDVEATYDDFFIEVKKLVGFEEAGVLIISDDNQYVVPAYFTNPGRIPFTVGQAYEIANTVQNQVIENRKAIILSDLTAESAPWAIDLTITGILSLIITPLIFEDKILGGFVFYRGEKGAFGDRELAIIDRLSSQVAPSLRNAALYQEADRFGLALDSIGEAVAFLDLDLTVRHVNRAFEETYGYTAGELRGRSIRIVSANDISESRRIEIFEQGVLNGWSGEVVRKTKTGELVDNLLTVSPVKDKSGKVIGRISVSRDITELKKTAERLMEQNRLASVGALAAGVAHEINNPLTTILLSSQLMSELDLPGDTLADLAIISNAARRAATIVQGLLLFARREDPHPEPMGLDSVVNQVLELKIHDFRRNNINAILEVEQQLPNCLVDNHQMSQVIVNILNNAEQALATHHNGGEITIKIESTPDAVTVEIHDDGPGIDSELLHKIFEPFYTTKQPGEGSGLGLSICHGIVQQHGGEMWVTSKIGVGTSFFVQLPVTSAVAVSPSGQRESTGTIAASNGRLLVIDDELAIRQLVAKGLSEEFEIVDQASDGEAALDLIQTSSYDCILLDLKMPGISGMEVYQRTAGYDLNAADRIIIMTGDTASPETASFLAELGNIVILKPFTLENVREAIKQVVGNHYSFDFRSDTQ